MPIGSTLSLRKQVPGLIKFHHAVSREEAGPSALIGEEGRGITASPVRSEPVDCPAQSGYRGRMTPAYDDTNIFAKILRGEIPCAKVFEDERTLAFMDVMPQGDGHTLVIPKARARTLFDLPPDDLAALMLRVQKIAAAVKAAFEADGLTLLQFNEPAGGQSVFHLHFHLIPRFEGVALRPHVGAMADGALLEAQAARIVAALDATPGA